MKRVKNNSLKYVRCQNIRQTKRNIHILPLHKKYHKCMNQIRQLQCDAVGQLLTLNTELAIVKTVKL